MIPAVHRFSAGGKEDSPAEHPTLPSRLHNFNFKSWGTQRHLRTRKPTTNTEPTSMSPWNLRAKRAEQGEEKTGEVVTSPIEEKFVERRVFCVTLLREEIEEDVYALKGTRPTRRPRKRPRGVQHQIDMLFPGCFLTEITLDTYKVVE
ncbi:uncharacterized protein LOC144571888 [Carex rostrata]